MEKVMNFLKDDTGLELSEYAVAAALIIAGLILAFSQLGSAILTRISQLTSTIIAGS